MKRTDDWFLCSCYQESILVSQWDDDSCVYVSFWKGRQDGSVGWSQRLRHIWKIIRTGEPWSDEVVLSQEEAMYLGEKLIQLGTKQEAPCQA